MSGKWMLRLGHLYTRIQKDDISGMGAQITYYLVLSFFPFLIFIVSMIGFISMNLNEMLATVTGMLPLEAHEFIVGFIADLQTGSSSALLSFGMIATIWSASKGILAILKGLNRAFDIEETRPFWKARLLSYIFTVLLGFVILFCLILLIFGRVLAEQLFTYFLLPGYFESVWNYAQYLIPLTSMILVFIALYKILPNKPIPLKTSIPGALFATFSWIIVSLLFSVYVNNFGSYSNTYGSIGGIIVFLIWLYISSMIILLGGHINAMLTLEKEGKPLQAAEWPNIPFLSKRKKDKVDPESPLSHLSK
ncbi:YihY/virulence factor BrkB family protein [Paenibacillus senegalensis]|uniref:YihY/virulence factor BrkB family protein n=1 Tax=Paenibacillus senegalensis TaxID=1465766 RepID=UPI00028A1774|nr:YihY/virulence factor BrkB family protein [Paenibacillus senegalensis]